MKTFNKIMRSIITSLLFLILIVAFIIQFFFTTIKMQGRIPDIINRNYILESLNTKTEVPEHLKYYITEYIDQYIKYIFYKRSYPSIDSLNYDNIEKEEKDLLKNILYDIKGQIDIPYENVVSLRNINNFLTNGSIYLIINISIFCLFLLLNIVTSNFKKSLKYFSITIFISSLLILSMNIWINNIAQKFINPVAYNLIQNSIDDNIINNITNLSFIYMFFSIILYFGTLYGEKIYLKFQK